MNKDIQIKQTIERIKVLNKKRKEILVFASEKTMERILDADQPAALVHSFPEEDLYFLIHDIGPEDALPLLSLASNRQWEYILDLEIWERDRINVRSITKWLNLLLKADPDRLIRWILSEKAEFIEYYLFKNIEVRIREHDQDPSVFGEEFFTHDDTFYVRFIGDTLDGKPKDSTTNPSEEFISHFLERLAAYDHTKYQYVLMEASSIIPAETEEEFYRMRNVRLAEKGFLPFHEAIGIYQPLNSQDFEKLNVKSIHKVTEQMLPLPGPFYPADMLKEDNRFTRSLKLINIEDVLEQIEVEFAGLCNRIIAADKEIVKNREELYKIVKKACGYISIGLKRLLEDKGKVDTGRSAALIQKYPLSQIFRVGYGMALKLNRKAEKWRKKSWFAKMRLPLSFWGEDWIGVLGGLLLKRPLFFDNYKTGVLYREFNSFEDINKTEKILNEIIFFDDLLSLIMLKPKTLFHGFVTYKNFILTLWAKHYLGLSKELDDSEEFSPLTLDEFKRFFNDLWAGEEKPRKVRNSMKESFLKWLSDKTGLIDYEITRRLGQTLENLFGEIESEYGEVDEKYLDSKYIHLFFLKRQKTVKSLSE